MRDDRWLDRAAERYQRNERRKRLKMLAGVGAYLFIGAIFGLWVLIGYLLYPERFKAKPQSKRRR